MSERKILPGIGLPDLGIFARPDFSGLDPPLRINADTYAGVFASHPGDDSPYRIEKFPEGIDRLPTNQAIAKLGGEYYYWDRMTRLLLYPELFRENWPFSMEILPVYMTQNGKVSVEISHLRYPYARLVNYGGDLTFPRPRNCESIFPIRVDLGDKQVKVTADELGVPEKIGVRLHDLFWGVYDAYAALFREAIKELMNTGGIDDKVIRLIEQYEEKGLMVSWPTQLIGIMVRGNIAEEINYQSGMMADRQVKEMIMEQKHDNPFVQAVGALAAQLGIAYNTAILNCPEYQY